MERLGDFVTIVGGGTPDRSTPEFWGGSIPWATVKDLQEHKHLANTQENITSAGVTNSATNVVQPGTVITATRIGLGKVGIATTSLAINQDLKALYCKPGLVPHYLYYFLRKSAPAIIAMGKGATVKGITLDDLKGLPMELPPIDVQQQIADTLEKADTLRNKDQELLQKYEELAQSIFCEMFGDPTTNEKGWRSVGVADLLSSTKDGTKCGPFGSALKKDDYLEAGIPVWAMDNIKNSAFIDDARLFISKEKFSELESYRVDSGDIIISRAGTVGKMCVVETSHPDSIISTNLIRLSLNSSQIHPEYFVSLFKYFGSRIGRLRKGADGAFTHMNTSILCSLSIPVPPLSLQVAYVRALEQLKNSKSLVTNNGTEKLFSALLNQYFA